MKATIEALSVLFKVAVGEAIFCLIMFAATANAGIVFSEYWLVLACLFSCIMLFDTCYAFYLDHQSIVKSEKEK